MLNVSTFRGLSAGLGLLENNQRGVVVVIDLEHAARPDAGPRTR